MQADVIEGLAKRIRAKWVPGYHYHYPLLPEITTAASLAHHGLLRSVEWMRLRDVDLSSVPAEHLASLASCVTDNVYIRNVNNTDLTSILDSSKSGVLAIINQSLSTEETRAVVRAMANVAEVALGYDVTVDMGFSTA